MAKLSRRGIIGCGLAAGFAPARVEPELVLHNGRLWTVDPARPEAEAIAIAGGHILAVGSSAEVLAMAGAATRKVDLGGHRVTPGFNDAHAHPCESGVDHLKNVACDKASIAEIQAALRERAGKTPPGQWVMGFLYDDGKTPRPLSRDDLDAAVPDRPVAVRHRGGHTMFVNSLALKLAGIDEATPNPAGGLYDRSDGRLNGRIADLATAPIDRLTSFSPTRDDYRQGAALISRMFNQKGVTSACDALGSPKVLQGYQDARDAGSLSMRTYCHIWHESFGKFLDAGLHTGLGDEMLRIGAIKLMADGSISERSAWLKEPYLDMKADYHGLQVQTREELLDFGRKAHTSGWQIGVHANGDLAIDEVVGVFEQLQKEHPRRDPRFRLEHCTMVTPELVSRIKAVGALPITFGGYVYFHGDVMHFYGAERTSRMFAMKSFLDAGVQACSSSDYTASPCDPMMWMQSQVTREGMDGKVWGPEQRISRQQAIACSTINGAHASFEEDRKGTLTPGKLADLVVFEQDPLAVDPHELVKVEVQRTMLGGRWVYEA
jgi:predicted amidohydrolase YtcJ